MTADTQGEGHVMLKAETGVVHCQPRTSSKSLEAAKRQERIPGLVAERAQSCQHLSFGFPDSRLQDNTFLLFQVTQFAVLCRGSHRTRM